jgi:hypothetical protein
MLNTRYLLTSVDFGHTRVCHVIESAFSPKDAAKAVDYLLLNEKPLQRINPAQYAIYLYTGRAYLSEASRKIGKASSTGRLLLSSAVVLLRQTRKKYRPGWLNRQIDDFCGG